jgi:hypothetical protein
MFFLKRMTWHSSLFNPASSILYISSVKNIEKLIFMNRVEKVQYAGHQWWSIAFDLCLVYNSVFWIDFWSSSCLAWCGCAQHIFVYFIYFYFLPLSYAWPVGILDKHYENKEKLILCARGKNHSKFPENTEPLASNDRRDTHIDTQTDGRDLWSMPWRWAQVP